jgi:hypothetical protein
LTRSHHKSPAIHIADDPISMKRSWCNLIQNVYRRSLSSGPEQLKTEVSKYPRPARTPPSTFLFLHLHLSNSPGQTPHSHSWESRKPHSTTNDNRRLSAVDSLIIMRSFTGTTTCLGRGPMQCRAQWPGYRPAQSMLSTAVVNKSSHHVKIFALRRSPDIRDDAPYLSHNPATF